ncbi:MAG: tetratricopeptide repeat protein [Bacteroidota bacterium]
MNTTLNELTDTALAVAKERLQNLALDEALAAIQSSLRQRQQDSGSDLSIYGNLLWCEVLLAKGRFLKDLTYAKMASRKLAEIQSLLPPVSTTAHFLSFHLSSAESHFQLDEYDKAKTVFNNLLTISKKERNEVGTIRALNGLAKAAFHQNKIIGSLEFANQALELLIQQTDENQYPSLVENYLLQSRILFQKEAFTQAKNYAERAIKISEERSLLEQQMEANLLFGQACIALKEYKTAMFPLMRTKTESLSVQHLVLKAESLLAIGTIHTQVFNYTKALNYLNKVADEYASILTQTTQIALQNNLGRTHFRLSQNEKAEHYFFKAKELAQQYRQQAPKAISLAYLSVLFARKGDYDKALRYASRVNKIREQIGDVDGVQVNLISLGNIHYQLEKYNEGIKLASRGIAAAKRMNDGLSEIRGYQIMAEIFRKKKDYKSAVMYQMIYTKFYEDFYQRNDRQAVVELEHQFEIQRLRKEIDRLSGLSETRTISSDL